MKTLTLKLTGETCEDIANCMRFLSWTVERVERLNGKGTIYNSDGVLCRYEVLEGIEKDEMKKVDRRVLSDAAFELNLSSYQLAAAAGIPQPFVASILLGERQPTAEQLKQLCGVLDLDPAECYQPEPVKQAA